MSEQHQGYGKLELRQVHGDKFQILVDGKVVEQDIRRKDVPKKMKEVLKEYE